MRKRESMTVYELAHYLLNNFPHDAFIVIAKNSASNFLDEEGVKQTSWDEVQLIARTQIINYEIVK